MGIRYILGLRYHVLLWEFIVSQRLLKLGFGAGVRVSFSVWFLSVTYVVRRCTTSHDHAAPVSYGTAPCTSKIGRTGNLTKKRCLMSIDRIDTE